MVWLWWCRDIGLIVHCTTISDMVSAVLIEYTLYYSECPPIDRMNRTGMHILFLQTGTFAVCLISHSFGLMLIGDVFDGTAIHSHCRSMLESARWRCIVIQLIPSSLPVLYCKLVKQNDISFVFYPYLWQYCSLSLDIGFPAHCVLQCLCVMNVDVNRIVIHFQDSNAKHWYRCPYPEVTISYPRS